ncbi:hypothetical protein [Phreatobacter stygius]|uniref:hypothetical protein n=1 Tax=Phreatobacter stygius TaxID=1940610 RepID=UPI001477557C|nr:hypothetical protein [Phreatobacter stygius]
MKSFCKALLGFVLLLAAASLVGSVRAQAVRYNEPSNLPFSQGYIAPAGYAEPH